MYPRYEYTNSDKILGQAKTELGITSTEHDFYLRESMLEAAREIPSFDMTEQKVETIEICDHKAKLPCGFIRFNEPNCIRVYDEFGGCYYPRTINNVMFQHQRSNTVQTMSNGESTTVDSWNWCNGIQLNNGYIYFSNDINATEAHVYFLSVLLDENDRPKMPLSHGRVIKAYMKYQWTDTFGDASKAARYYSKWANGKKALKGQANMPNINEKEELFLIWNTLL